VNCEVTPFSISSLTALGPVSRAPSRMRCVHS